jgi:hypothetical protein
MEKKHPNGWNLNTHYMSIGGQCGQSCPCCRSQVGDTLGSCPICNDNYKNLNKPRKIIKNKCGKWEKKDKNKSLVKRKSLPRNCKKN